jgi:hypothetical protein
LHVAATSAPIKDKQIRSCATDFGLRARHADLKSVASESMQEDIGAAPGRRIAIMSRTSLACLAILATTFVLAPDASAYAQRGLAKGGLVQTRYLTDEQRAARGWRSRGGGLSTATALTKNRNVKRKRVARPT